MEEPKGMVEDFPKQWLTKPDRHLFLIGESLLFSLHTYIFRSIGRTIAL